MLHTQLHRGEISRRPNLVCVRDRRPPPIGLSSNGRGRWLAVAVWLLIGVAGLTAHSHIDDVTAAGQSSFLPADSESTRAIEAIQHASAGREDVPVVIVIER